MFLLNNQIIESLFLLLLSSFVYRIYSYIDMYFSKYVIKKPFKSHVRSFLSMFYE